MAIFSRLRPGYRRSTTDTPGTPGSTTPPIELSTTEYSKRDSAAAEGAPGGSNDGAVPPAEAAAEEVPDEELQHGVKDVEAVTLTWSKWTLIFVFFNMWMLYFVNAFQSSILDNLLPFVTSDFEAHSLLNVIYIVADAMSAAVFIPTAKVMDVFGRAEGFLIMTIFCTLGLVLMAACNGLATFCAAYTFYTIGFSGLTYCVDVITADASQLKNRGLAYAFTSSPYMITAFAGAKASDDFYYNISWRWGFGCFAIIFPVVAAPLYFVLKSTLKTAQKQGLAVKEPSGRTWWQSIWHYTVEFDALGVISFSIGLTVFLLPFTIATDAPDGWDSGYIIAMLVVGFVVLVLFALYEQYLAPVPMLNFTFLTDRTVIAACLLDMTYQVSYYCWANYFTSFLMVVNDLTLAQAGYVNDTFDVVSGVLLLGTGWVIRKTGRFKWTLYIAVPLYIFTQGLMIYFRRANQNVGYLVMCQIFISIGGSIFIIIEQLAILAAVDHQHVAAVLALLNVVGTVGDAMGATISGAIWTNTFKKALARNLTGAALKNIDNIYEDLDTQLSYPVGSVARYAIQESYGYAQTRMLAAGVGVMGLALIWTMMFRNIDLHKFAQVKGMVW